MKRRSKLGFSLVAILAITVQMVSPVAVQAASYSSFSSTRKILALQYRYALNKCLEQSESIFGASYDNTNSLPDISNPYQMNYTDANIFGAPTFAAGNSISLDGSKISCDRVIEGYRDEVAEGGAYKFFGITDLSKHEVWTKVFGYKATLNDAGSSNITYKFKATIRDGQAANVVVSHELKLDSGGNILNTNDDIFAQFAHHESALGNIIVSVAQDEFLGGNSSRFESYYKDFLTREWMGTGCSFYARESSPGCTMQYNAALGAMFPSRTIDIAGGNLSVSKVNLETTYKYTKPTTTIANNVDGYIMKAFFGNITEDLSVSSSDKVLAYEFWYDYLFGKGTERCGAQKKLMSAPEVKNNARFDKNYNNYLYELRLVDETGVLVPYYAEWGGEQIGSGYAGTTDGTKNIGLIKKGDTDGDATCKEIASNLKTIAEALTPSDKAKIAANPKLTALSPEDNGEITDGDTEGEDGEKPNYCVEGAGALGWIVCPLLTYTSETINDLYEKVVNPFLSINSELVSSSNERGTYKAWRLFQSLANIVFIILLLVVIFSQLTGVGIDNYGIKKALPKLIIAAILINLSYIICQLAVDVSNIAGYGIKSLLDGAAESIGEISLVIPDTGSAPIEISKEATAWTGVIGALGLLVGGVALFSQGFAIILPLLFAVIGAFIALIFVFVLLGARQAGVVLLVALSPLAFVLYILPNTKNLFDKWIKMFTGLLLFFPIVGLLMGGGNLASKILLSAKPDDFFTALIAMLLNVIPFFFIPTLLKGSFTAMGNIGAKISGIGQKFNSGVGKVGRPALEQSRFGQRVQRGKNYRDYRRAEKNKVLSDKYMSGKAAGVERKYGGKDISKLRLGERARLATARQILASTEKQNTSMYADYFAGLGTGQAVSEGLVQALKADDADMAAAAISELSARGDYDQLTEALSGIDPASLSASMKDRLSNSLITHKKDAAHLWGWSKQMKSGNNMTLSNYVSSGTMVKDLSKEQDDLMSTQDKTSLEAISKLTKGNSKMAFSDKQIRNAATNLDKEASVQQFNNMLNGMSENDRENLFSGMNAAQVAKLKGSTVDQLVYGAKDKSGRLVTRGIGESGFRNWIGAGTIAELNNPQNANLVAAMNPSVKRALGI